MNNKSNYNNTEITYPAECPNCRNRKIQPVSEYSGEYHYHWIIMICRQCQHQWREIYRMDV